MSKIPIVKIDDVSQAWLDNPISLEDFDAKVKKEFKNQWKQWLNKWILVVDKNKRPTYKIRLVGKGGKLYPEAEGEEVLMNLYAGILFTVLKDLIQNRVKEGK